MPRVYKASRTSLSPMILPTKGTEKSFKDLKKMQTRMVEGYKLVALEATSLVLAYIKKHAPEIDGDKYSDRLEAIYSVDNDGSVIVSIIGKNKERESTVADATSIGFLYPKGMLEPNQMKAYEVLKRYQPWPIGLYPLPTGTNAKIGLVSRRVSASEYRIQVDRIRRLKGQIEVGLSGAGFDVTIEETADPKAVSTDLAFAILQIEYGIGRKPDTHWRTAIAELKRELGVLQDKFKKYVATGRDSIFSIDSSIVEVAKIKELDNQLQEKVARSTGLPVEKF